MNEQTDCREDVINSLCMWAGEHGINMQEAKCDFYMILNDAEITSRCTEIAEVQGDRNEMLLKKFLIAKQVKGCTPRTIAFYRQCIVTILLQIGKTVDDITADDIRFYMAIRLRRDKVTKTTVANEIRSLSSFFSWLYIEEIIRRNPMLKIDKIKQEKTKKEALTEMEIEKLRSAADGVKEKNVDRTASLNWMPCWRNSPDPHDRNRRGSDTGSRERSERQICLLERESTAGNRKIFKRKKR